MYLTDPKEILRKAVRSAGGGPLTSLTREMGSCGTFNEEAEKGRCDMNKVLKTMVAVAALTFTANADNVTANETALWNEIQRVFLTWNGKGADQYASHEVVRFTDAIGNCQADWGSNEEFTRYDLHYDFGDAATCADYDDAYQTVVGALNAYGKITGAKEDKTYLTYEWTLADGTTIKIGPAFRAKNDETCVCTRKHRHDWGCAIGMTLVITIKR